jgi:hypothetical protein
VHREERWTLILLTVLSLAGVGTILIATRWGAGLSPDTAAYVGSARGLLAGRGLVVPHGPDRYRPMTHYPPLYPLVLALVGLTGIDPLAGTRPVAAAVCGAIVFLTGLMVYRRTRGPWVALLAAFVALTAAPLLAFYVMALSEPLYVLMVLLCLFALAHHLDRGRWTAWLLAALAAGAALCTRYAGTPVVAVGMLGLWVFGRGSRRRLLSGLAFGAVACMPAALWVLRNLQVAQTAVHRQVLLSLPDRDDLLIGVTELWDTLVPGDLPWPVRALPLVMLLAAAACYAGMVAANRARPRAARPAPLRRLPTLLLSFAVIHVAALIAARFLVYPSCNLNRRFLWPAILPVWVAVVCLVHDRWRRTEQRRAFRSFWIVLSAVLVVGCTVRAFRAVSVMRRYGSGSATRAWHRSEMLGQVRRLPPDAVVYSNLPAQIYLHTGRPARGIPRTYANPETALYEAYRDKLQMMRRDLFDRGGFVAFFRAELHMKSISEQELLRLVPLRAVYRDKHGAIYRTTSSEQTDSPQRNTDTHR